MQTSARLVLDLYQASSAGTKPHSNADKSVEGVFDRKSTIEDSSGDKKTGAVLLGEINATLV